MLTLLPSPAAIGDALAVRILAQMAVARAEDRRYLLGCPTGRTPRPIFAAMARRLGERAQDLSHVTLVMMDEYLVAGDDGLQYAPSDAPWSCHCFARVEIVEPLNVALAPAQRLREAHVWFPLPADPGEYDQRIAAAGGIDLFLLASGVSDGHVAFNPPGSPRESRTRIIPLSDDTRRDNLQTFPTFGSLDAVPFHGVSVGIATIVESRAAIMVAWGASKGQTVARMRGADRYEADWPATLIHECADGEIFADEAAAS